MTDTKYIGDQQGNLKRAYDEFMIARLQMTIFSLEQKYFIFIAFYQWHGLGLGLNCCN